MGKARRLNVTAAIALLTLSACSSADVVRPPICNLPPSESALASLASPADPASAPTPELPAVPPVKEDNRPVPISLLAAMRLGNVRAVDIAAASERVKIALAALEGAEVLWLPTITLGGDYNRHDGRNQDTQGNVFDNSRSSAMLGLGTGIGNAAILDVGAAIFTPLYAKQQVKVRQADLQAASNDTVVAISDAYFSVQQARGDLASAIDTRRRTEQLVARTRLLAPEIAAELERFRAEAELAARQQAELLARERWKVASAELVRLLRLDPVTQVEPAEPPQFRIELIDVNKPVDELIPIGLTYRPELASQQAQVQATLVLLKQERLRPLIPSILLRGYSTPVAGTLGAGYFGGGANSTIANGGLRSDIDLQVLFQLNNLGFGNRALVHQREAENRLAMVELFRIQDRVAKEVAEAHAQAQLAVRRVEVAEKGLRSAILSVEKNFAALKETKAAGKLEVTLVRPQEVVAAIQALAQRYSDYYGAVADANRAQFRLYRALGQPAHCLASQDRATTASTVDPPASAPTSPAAAPAAPGAAAPTDTRRPPRATLGPPL